jgi:hypothetical protein
MSASPPLPSGDTAAAALTTSPTQAVEMYCVGLLCKLRCMHPQQGCCMLHGPDDTSRQARQVP